MLWFLVSFFYHWFLVLIIFHSTFWTFCQAQSNSELPNGIPNIPLHSLLLEFICGKLNFFSVQFPHLWLGFDKIENSLTLTSLTNAQIWAWLIPSTYIFGALIYTVGTILGTRGCNRIMDKIEKSLSLMEVIVYELINSIKSWCLDIQAKG